MSGTRRGRGKKRDTFVSLQVGAEGPGSRHGHSAVMEEKGGGLMIIFGGSDQHGSFHNNMYQYNVESREWTEIVDTNGTKPTGRQYHSAVLHDGNMYIFAGTSNGYYNDLHRFHIDSQTWELVETKGTAPSPRFGHTAVVHANSMFVFGGYDKNGLSCHDLYELTLDSCTWRRLFTKGLIPDDVYHHSSVVYQDSMYVFGGYRTENNCLYEFRFATSTWSTVHTKGKIPSPRWGHNMIVFNDTLYMFGGRDAVANSCDLYEFHFTPQEWRKSVSRGIAARFFASAVAHDQYMYVFGGTNIFNFSFGDLYLCDLASSPCTLVSDFRALLNDEEFADMVFIFPNEPDRRIFAHRCILAARCSTFSAMMESGMKESLYGEIQIPHLTYEAFYAVLEYLYTGELFAAPSELIQVLQAADLYQLSHLKRASERKLERYVDLVNAVYMYQTAHKFKAEMLKSYCLDFVSKNYEVLHETESFKVLEPELVQQVQRQVSFDT